MAIQVGEGCMMKIEMITMDQILSNHLSPVYLFFSFTYNGVRNKESIDNRSPIGCQDSGPPVTALLDTLHAMTRRANAPEEMDDDVSELRNELLVVRLDFRFIVFIFRR